MLRSALEPDGFASGALLAQCEQRRIEALEAELLHRVVKALGSGLSFWSL